jgi:hypothetical protein
LTVPLDLARDDDLLDGLFVGFRSERVVSELAGESSIAPTIEVGAAGGQSESLRRLGCHEPEYTTGCGHGDVIVLYVVVLSRCLCLLTDE